MKNKGSSLKNLLALFYVMKKYALGSGSRSIWIRILLALLDLDPIATTGTSDAQKCF